MNRGWTVTFVLLHSLVGAAESRAAALSVRDVVVPMSQCRAHNATFPVQLSGGSAQPVTVQYGTADGTAVAGVDYTAMSGTLTFRPGTRVRFVRVPVADVSAPGPKKTFFLNLTNAANATLAGGPALATIDGGRGVRAKQPFALPAQVTRGGRCA